MRSSSASANTGPLSDAEAAELGADRFEFGANWHQFLSVLTEQRVRTAEQSLADMLGLERLDGLRFLDIGCGSGLFSLAARRLGAEVYSFDFDPMSVHCAEELRRRFYPGDPSWQIARGSVLDSEYLDRLGEFDVVYSWGVLHHTGAMWTAIDNASRRVKPGGRLFIAIYNDQGAASIWWTRVKRTYNRLPAALKRPYLFLFGAALEAGAVGTALLRMQPRRLIDRWTRYENVRGMSRWHDIVDWVGGYPFEVATPEAIIDFCLARHFVLRRLKTCGGKMGCNEFVFTRMIGGA
jgi:2-polyprenyl-6-hydroxyphenyl methylase/3-demethylubiquinone-9 3-methyltransferase